MTVVHLASSTNNQGYNLALHKTWIKSGLRLTQTPSKSSLCEYRDKVSHLFFKDIFQTDLKRFDGARKTFRGFYIYAIDGDQLDLPQSTDLLNKGYRGYPYSKGKETHYLKMYTAQAVDLVNGMVKEFGYSNKLGEARIAHQLVSRLEKRSITLYDRLYDSYATAFMHKKAGNYFFIRIKTKNPKVQDEIRDFCRSHRRQILITLNPPRKDRLSHKPLKVRLIKVKNSKTQEDIVFMTNAEEGIIKNKEAAALYQRRWGVESSFKDLTDTLKMCQWRSKKLNTILQEVYALFWLVNNVRRLCNTITKDISQWLKPTYKKANFKLITELLIDHIELLIKRKHQKLGKILNYWIYRSIEKREHLSRSYPRIVRGRSKMYPNASVVRRKAA